MIFTEEDKAVERAARAIWTATGHRESDWIYMAPETDRKRRYMGYGQAAYEAINEVPDV